MAIKIHFCFLSNRNSSIMPIFRSIAYSPEYSYLHKYIYTKIIWKKYANYCK